MMGRMMVLLRRVRRAVDGRRADLAPRRLEGSTGSARIRKQTRLSPSIAVVVPVDDLSSPQWKGPRGPITKNDLSRRRPPRGPLFYTPPRRERVEEARFVGE